MPANNTSSNDPATTHDTGLNRKASYITAIVGNLPLRFGQKIRSMAYRSILARLGNNVTLHPRIDLVGPHRIHLDDNVILYADVGLNAWVDGSEITIGHDVVMERGVYLQALGAQLTIGAQTYIGPYVCLSGPGSVQIGKNVLIGASSSLFANNHGFSDPNTPINQQPLSCKGITIEDDCWLGAGVRIMDGIRVGMGSVIGAGAVVTKDIPANSVAVGVPAKIIGQRG